MDGDDALIQDLEEWRRKRLRDSRFACEPIAFRQSRDWFFEKGRLRHKSGGLFSVIGVRTEANELRLHGREQVILDQRKPAVIGLAMLSASEGTQLLLQGRIEPGNVNGLQFGPTVQSTQANYMRLHGGRPTAYIDVFIKDRHTTILDELQSEEGSRYLCKYNQTVAKILDAGVFEAPIEGFRLIDLATLRALSGRDNWINTEARSILACIDWSFLALPRRAFEDGSEIGAMLRASYQKRWERVDFQTLARALARWRSSANLVHFVMPLEELSTWRVGEAEIADELGEGGFVVRHYDVTARDREVPYWDQPLIDSGSKGLVALIGQEQNGVLRFLIRAGYEIGLRDGVAFTASYARPPGEPKRQASAIEGWILSSLGEGVICGLRQSEEGGRFYQDENEYVISLLPADAQVPEDPEGFWLTLGEIEELIASPGFCSIELRCICSLFLTYL